MIAVICTHMIPQDACLHCLRLALANAVANALRHQSAVVAAPPAAQDVMAAAMARIAAATDQAALGEVGAGLAKLDVDEGAKRKLRAAFTARRKELEAA